MLKVLHKIKRVGMVAYIKRISLKRVVAYGIVAVMSLYAVVFMFPPVHDDNTSAMIGTAVASDTTLSLAITNGTLTLDLTPTSSNGTFATTSTSAVVKVSTNNITGYTLGIKSSNEDAENADKLVNTDTNITTKNTINSITSSVSKTNYEQNNIENTDLNNTWGYSPSYYNSTINTLEATENNPFYYPAPVNGDILNITDSPNPVDDTILDNNNEPTGELQQDEYTINFGSRIDYSIYSGTYTNPTTFTITAVGNQVPYSVSYDANKPEQAPATATVDNVPTAQTGSAQGGDTVAVVINTKVPTLGTKDTTDPDNPTYTYAGYVFNGWCSIQPETPATINGQTNTLGYQVCPETATIYQPGDSFGIDQTVDNAQTLYATWGAPATVTFNSNGLIYNNDTTDTVNTVTYIPTYEGNKITGQRTNTIYTGTYKTPAYEITDPITNIVMKGWSTDQNATEAAYTDEAAITETLSLSSGDTVELYAIWNYATKITFNKNNADGTETMNPQYIEVGTTAVLDQNVYTNTGYILGSWNTVQTPTEQDPGETYADQANFTAGSQSADITLYAQWVVPPRYLYNEVKSLVKKSGDTELTQTAADLKEVITKPTSSDPSVDTSNSGVYKYNASVFGAASDASNEYAIYYYRGILDSNLDDTSSSSYGSNGDGVYYPNYVKLGDTCWRIVRTTGSGGVKMIYNGLYSSGTTANSCANAQANAQVATKGFNGDSTTHQQAVRVGYTYNSTYATNTAQTASIANVFGSDTNSAANNTDSTIKDYIEDEWFTSAIGSYESKLEPSAGYCNDRTVYDNTSPYTQQTENTSIVTYGTYGTSGLNELNFGSYVRNKIDNGTRTLTLSCARSTVDLYTTSAATNGNKQLSHPVALLTADEAALAGSGGNGRTSEATQSSNYSYSSYLRSGSDFWLLSPTDRDLYGYVMESFLYSSGTLNYRSVRQTYGVRPSISLNHETTVKSGTGTATDPWIINE